MFREIQKVRQEPGGRRRWFESDNLHLIVWLKASGEITGFQLCYDFGRGEFALTWRDGAGFTHAVVDQGDHTPLKNQSPVLRPAGPAPWAEILCIFDARSGSLEPPLRELVRDRLAARVSPPRS